MDERMQAIKELEKQDMFLNGTAEITIFIAMLN